MATTLKKLLNNQAILYFFLLLGAVNVVLYLCTKRYECLGILLLTTYLSHFVTSNYTLDIIIALIVANVIFGCGVYKEGVTNRIRVREEDDEKPFEQSSQQAPQGKLGPQFGAGSAQDLALGA